MSLEDELTQAMLEAYRRAGEEVGYWGQRFYQAVNRNGGIATAKRMMQPRTSGQRKGLDALLAANRPDLTLEHLILEDRFAPLFTDAELGEARRRLGLMNQEAERHLRERVRLYPDELEPGRRYPEGARKQVRVNAYERNPRARRDCLAHHGVACACCGLNFEEQFGEIGRGFIHVHHKNPLALATDGYSIDPVRDLVPVCPNCHVMLHRRDPPLEVDELKKHFKPSN